MTQAEKFAELAQRYKVERPRMGSVNSTAGWLPAEVTDAGDCRVFYSIADAVITIGPDAARSLAAFLADIYGSP